MNTARLRESFGARFVNATARTPMDPLSMLEALSKQGFKLRYLLVYAKLKPRLRPDVRLTSAMEHRTLGRGAQCGLTANKEME